MPENNATAAAIRCRAVATLLREPERRVRHLLAKNRRFLTWLESRRNQPQPARVLARHAAGICIPQARAFRDLARHDPRSRIVASFHYGDFVYGLHGLMCLEPRHRRRLVLVQSPGTAAYFANTRRAFGSRAVGPEGHLLVSETSPRRLASWLRGGDSSLVTFCDLPHGIGSRTSVRLLARLASFSRGAATLAMVSNTPLLPVICTSERGRTQVHIYRQLEPVPRLDESRDQAIVRLTQRLALILEQQVSEMPDRWRYLTLLPEFYPEPGTATGRQINRGDR